MTNQWSSSVSASETVDSGSTLGRVKPNTWNLILKFPAWHSVLPRTPRSPHRVCSAGDRLTRRPNGLFAVSWPQQLGKQSSNFNFWRGQLSRFIFGESSCDQTTFLPRNVRNLDLWVGTSSTSSPTATANARCSTSTSSARMTTYRGMRSSISRERSLMEGGSLTLSISDVSGLFWPGDTSFHRVSMQGKLDSSSIWIKPYFLNRKTKKLVNIHFLRFLNDTYSHYLNRISLIWIKLPPIQLFFKRDEFASSGTLIKLLFKAMLWMKVIQNCARTQQILTISITEANSQYRYIVAVKIFLILFQFSKTLAKMLRYTKPQIYGDLSFCRSNVISCILLKKI